MKGRVGGVAGPGGARSLQHPLSEGRGFMERSGRSTEWTLGLGGAAGWAVFGESPLWLSGEESMQWCRREDCGCWEVGLPGTHVACGVDRRGAGLTEKTEACGGTRDAGLATAGCACRLLT